MSYGLFDTPDIAVNGMNIPSVPLLAPTPPQSEIERAAEIEAEKQRLLGNEVAAKSAENVKAIVNGEYDHLPEAAFYMVGTIEEAVKKAETLKEKA